MPKQVRRVSKEAMLWNSFPGNTDKKCLTITCGFAPSLPKIKLCSSMGRYNFQEVKLR